MSKSLISRGLFDKIRLMTIAFILVSLMCTGSFAEENVMEMPGESWIQAARTETLQESEETVQTGQMMNTYPNQVTPMTTPVSPATPATPVFPATPATPVFPATPVTCPPIIECPLPEPRITPTEICPIAVPTPVLPPVAPDWRFKAWAVAWFGNITNPLVQTPACPPVAGAPVVNLIVDDANFVDPLRNTGFIVRVEGSSQNFGLFADYMRIRVANTPIILLGAPQPGLVTLTHNIAQLAAFWRAYQEGLTTVDVFAGARYHHHFTTVTLPGVILTEQRNPRFTDPIIGAKAEIGFAENFTADAYADVGGFGVGSSFTWRAAAAVNWHVAQNFFVRGGYEALHFNYERGDLPLRYRYRATIHGPVLGIGVRF
jgi:hypothetical protein